MANDRRLEKASKFCSLATGILIVLFLPMHCNAELLQVSADGTVHLSSDSIEIKSNADGKYVNGIIYVREAGGTGISPFSTTCSKNGGVLQFRNATGELGPKNKWFPPPRGQGAIDAIGLTACQLAHLI